MQRQPRILIVYFSRSGATRKVAEMITEELDCDIEELRESDTRAGLCGYLRSGFEATFGIRPELRPTLHDPSAYDLVVLGTPIWNASVSSPVRTYADRNARHLRNVAFFLTQGGTGARRVFAQLTRLCGNAPVATLAVKARDLMEGAAKAETAEFVGMLKGFLARAPEYSI